MEAIQKRVANVKKSGRAYCISHIYINGVYFCDAIEDEDRGLNQSMSEAEIAKIKVKTKTAIPCGDYIVKINIPSAKFAQKSYYWNFCKGKMPRLDPVKGFAGILIHRGVNEASSAGCIIVGYNKTVGAVVNSQEAFEKLYKKLKEASDNKETISWKIERTYTVK